MENYNNRKNEGDITNIELGNMLTEIRNYINNGDLGKDLKLFSEGGPINKLTNSEKISTTQIRKFYSEILYIEDLARIYANKNPKINQEDFEKLRIKLALLEPLAHYSAIRQKNLYKLKGIIVEAIKTINSENDHQKWLEKFERFKQVFEVIVAYSKEKSGGKNE
ncbi:MAG: type III-A CRISPR-associated protein Csm2 [Thermoplasmata archaeon]